ncbi:preprotein translocase subunit SecG [bacterium]|nr:preprotein translocase subunit SecG [bacterium]
MNTLLLILAIISSILMVVLVLLHSAKGEGFGAIGGQARLFSSQRGLESGLNLVTAIVGGIFIIATLLIGAIQ